MRLSIRFVIARIVLVLTVLVLVPISSQAGEKLGGAAVKHKLDGSAIKQKLDGTAVKQQQAAAAFKQRLTEAIEKHSRQLSNSPIENYEARAWCNYQLGHYDEAITDYSEVIRLSAENQRNAQVAYFGRASAYIALKKFDDAFADYESAQKPPVKPLMTDFFMNLAMGFLAGGVILVGIAVVLFGPKGALRVWLQNQATKDSHH